MKDSYISKAGVTGDVWKNTSSKAKKKC